MAGSFDVVVIGGGPGGYVAALRAAQLGAKTAIVEKDRMGGTCLVRGCIPTKALLQSSELYTLAKGGQPFGLVADNIGFDWPAAQKRKASVVDQLVKGVEGLLKAGGVTSYRGAARLAGKGVVDVGGDQVQAKDIVIATGSAIARIPMPGAELTIDSDQILELREVPKRLAVIGGGVVGMEFAAMFAALGSKVTVLEMLPQVLAMVDADLVNVYTKHLAGLGGEVHTDTKVGKVVKGNGGLQVQFSSGGEGGAVEADQVLLAVGRVPYTDGLDAEKAGVKLDRRRVVVDQHLHTDADGVWAIGDVIGGIMLAHVASYEGVCAVENIAGHSQRVPDYHAAPNCVYTDPEIAHVGLGEKEAKEKGVAVKVGRFPFAASGRALTLGQSEGFAKVLSDPESGRLLGAHIIGPRATDLIAEATLAVQNGLTLEQIDLTIHAHPTLPESLMEAALAAQGRAIHIANRRTAAAQPPSGPTQTAQNNQNREKEMATTIKPSSPPPTPDAINAKSLELTKNNRDFLLGLHRQMQLIRRFEERAQEQYTKAKIGGYCHLNIGEEATVVGGILALKANDWIFTSYREHGHAIARGVDPKAVMAELFGKETGTSHGRGGSMHLVDYSRRFMGGYGIVGGHLPLAVGGAWAVRYRKQKDVVFCMFGDGATNIGAFHESLNMSKVFDLPVVWFCVNNRYGMGTPVEAASAIVDIYKKACAYDMESIQVDGMNLREVLLRTSEMVEKTRNDSQPRFVEALCYRFRGHSVVDPDKYRSNEDKEKWRKADPIVAFEHELEKSGLADEEYFKNVRVEVDNQVKDIIQFADESPDPKTDDLYKYVYAGQWDDNPALRAERV
ncbi:MAG: dihydrolipoyl dehydrogenase [Chloroflexi bacterium]|nr:MAG: dihydrolipoyl dehydrogenase [Chloroflexota bacterium]TMF96871.1 MAG: dihydrolipoyl dehydrogenase [Chloroflexota bacterium]